ncbi:MAG: PorP/SprF family type IX secretion system membrane protein [Chitinophagales bacterium]
MRISLLILLLFLLADVKSQQWIQFTQLNQYRLYNNTAYTGYNSQIDAVVAHRSLYVGLGTKAMYSQQAAFGMPVATPKLGLGFRFLNDKIGLQRYSQLELSAAYHPLQNKHKLSIGASVGFVQLGLKGNEITAPDGSYPSGMVVHNDAYLPNENSNGIAPSFSFGVVYGIKNFEVGASIQNINSPRIKISKTQSGTIIFINRTINISALYVIKLKSVNLTPLFYVKTDFLKWQMQLQAMLEWKKLMIGAGFRGYNGLNNDAVFGIIGLNINDRYKVGYSYDYNLSYLNNSNTGSHELSFRLNINKGFKGISKENILFNPRFL